MVNETTAASRLAQYAKRIPECTRTYRARLFNFSRAAQRMCKFAKGPPGQVCGVLAALPDRLEAGRGGCRSSRRLKMAAQGGIRFRR